SQTVTVHAATSDGTASAADYTAVSVDVTFAAGETSKQLAVSTLEDDIDEPDETVTVTLSDPSAGATIADGTGVLTINDDDATPAISIGNASVSEGDSGNTPAAFTLTLSGPSSQSVTVKASTGHSSTNSLDLTSFTHTVVTFAPGDTSETISVQVTGDNAPEANEAFVVTLADPSNATIADGSGAGTITDDDAAGTYNPVTPARVLDTRSGIGRPGTSKVTGGQTVTLDVTGVGGVPTSGVRAVAINVTVTGPTGGGFVSATPSGSSTTSNVNYATGEVVANLVIVPVANDGNIRLYTSRTTHIVGDVFGWFSNDAAATPGSHFTSLTPTRVLDTRNGTGVPGGSTAKLAAGTNRVLDITGAGGVPNSGVAAVILNVTVTKPTVSSFLSVTPNGGTSTSNINFAAGETVAGHVIVPVDGSGVIRYAVGGGATHVVADVFGWFATPGTLTGSVLTTVTPARLLDTRPNPDDRLGPDEYGVLQIAGEGGVPAEGAAAAVLNLTVTQPTASSYLTVSLNGEDGTSNINFVKNQTVANLAVVPIHDFFGDIVIYNNAGYVHIIVDVFAWFSTPAP
ncbi:MAG: Calx-beta domain-containing protein, partial [Actinomycetota bacterium]